MVEHFGAARGEHGFTCLVDELDAQALIGFIDDQVVDHAAQLRDVVDGLTQGLLGSGALLLFPLGQKSFEGRVLFRFRRAVGDPARASFFAGRGFIRIAGVVPVGRVGGKLGSRCSPCRTG